MNATTSRNMNQTMPLRVGRRRFIGCGAGAASSFAIGCWSARTYPGWHEGEFDIHFIHTGVGEQTFFIFPDGTTMLLDCGDTHHAKYMVDVPPSPSKERLGGEWTSRYIRRLTTKREIDYLMVSHWHGDHVGDPALGCRKSAEGHSICGITAVAENFRFVRYLDHQYPNAGMYARDPDPEAFKMMQEWIPRAQRETGMMVEPFRVGSYDQISLKHNSREYGNFEVRNIAANAVLWDGRNGTIDCGREHVEAGGDAKIHENRLSAVIRIRYGQFSYYTGGDVELTLRGADGKDYNWEERIGRTVGPVHVCKTNHHAGGTAMSAGFVKAVRPRVYLSSVWQAGMVNEASLANMTSRDLYPGDRLICFGYIADRVKPVAARFAGDLAPAGHAVVKVLPGGGAYTVYILDASDESMRILGERTFIC